MAIEDSYKGADDDEVLSIALREDSLLITEDKDFGELVFRLNKAHIGKVLLRLSGLELELKNKIVIKSMKENYSKMENSFSVISPSQTRIRK